MTCTVVGKRQGRGWGFGLHPLNRRPLQVCEGDFVMTSSLARMVRAGGDEGRILERALDGLAEVFGDPDAAEEVGPHVTCDEADRIAWALVASRHADAAVVWLDKHAATDTDEDRHGGDGFDVRRYITGGQ